MSIKEKWKIVHSNYKTRDWINKPSIFATEVLKYLPENGKLLELGAGHGQDSRYFAENGFSVISTDSGDVGLEENKKKSESSGLDVRISFLDLNQPFPFEDNSFDVVYAHLSLHYFSDIKTMEIFDEIFRVLKPEGILAFFTNSTDDPEFNTGIKLEEYYFETEGLNKRYLNTDEALRYAHRFETIVCDNNGETYKDREIGVHNLIRYIGKKSSQ